MSTPRKQSWEIINDSNARAISQPINIFELDENNMTVINGLSEAFANEAQPLTVLVECNTGADRCGVATPEAAASTPTTLRSWRIPWRQRLAQITLRIVEWFALMVRWFAPMRCSR